MAGRTSRTAKVREQDYVNRRGVPLAVATQHLPWPSALSPTGLVPVLCGHGLKTLPPDHPPVARTPSYRQGGELPPFGGHSWVLAHHALINFKCTQCKTGERPADLTGYLT